MLSTLIYTAYSGYSSKACALFHAMLRCIDGDFELAPARLDALSDYKLTLSRAWPGGRRAEIDLGGRWPGARSRAKRDRVEVLHTIFGRATILILVPAFFPSSSLRNGCQLQSRPRAGIFLVGCGAE